MTDEQSEKTGKVNVPKIGDHVMFVSPKGPQAHALVDEVHDTYINLHIVVPGRGQVSHSSVPHKGDDERFYWCWAEEL